MGNQNNQQRNGGYNPKQFSAEELVAGLEKVAIPLNKAAINYREKTSALQVKLEDLIANTFGISEIDHVFVMPKISRDGQLQTVLCRAYFNTQNVTSGNIVRRGVGSAKGGTRTILDLAGMGAATGSGDFELSDQFKAVFAPLSPYDDGQLKVGSIPRNRDIACVDIDFFAIMTMALGIDSNAPYDFSILSAEPIGRGDDYVLLISKYISTNNGKRGRHKGSRVDYNSLDKEWSKQNNAYASGNRSFS